MVNHIVMFSGGIGSWAAAKRVAETHGTENLYLVFTDVKGNSTNPHIGEDEDTYRFIKDAAENVGGQLIMLNTGKTIWDVFEQKKFLGNNRLAPCSHELKQKPARQWLEANFKPEDTIVYVGIDWSEIHRLEAIKRNYKPYQAKAPMTDKPYLDKNQMIAWAKEEGIETPRLYDLGFAHNNCGGGCVRAGQGQFKQLLQIMPERFAEWEKQEENMRQKLGRDVSILKRTTNGKAEPLTLKQLRHEVSLNATLFDDYDIGGCNCFVDYED